MKTHAIQYLQNYIEINYDEGRKTMTVLKRQYNALQYLQSNLKATMMGACKRAGSVAY